MAVYKAPLLEERRAVTLAMEGTGGALFSELREPQGLAWKEVVLAADGASFLAGAALAMPHVEDVSMYRRLTAGFEEEGQTAGFVLPEAVLLDSARTLLNALAGHKPFAVVPDKRFLSRTVQGQSLLERAAQRNRAAGSAFWEPFLDWVLRRFPIETLADQKILPVAADQLACAADRVFLEPMRRAESTEAAEDEEIEVEALHEDVQSALRFLDSNAIPVRTGTRKDVTPLVLKLSPLAGAGLVARPRVEDLVRHAIVPRLAEITQDAGRREVAVELLRFTIRLVQRLKPQMRTRVDVSRLVVPAGRAGEPWAWVAPDTVYLGPGWLEGKSDEMLSRAYGSRPRGRLVPWEDFSACTRDDGADARAWWRMGMEMLGVAARPRLLTSERSCPAFKSYSNERLAPQTVSCPITGAKRFWEDYLHVIAERPNCVKSGQPYEVAKVQWIDGLEHDHARASVIELVLAQPGEYQAATTTEIRRPDMSDSSSAPAFWVHVIRTKDWPIVPTESDVYPDFVPPSRAFWLTSDDRRKDSTRLLAAVPARFTEAVSLLRQLGITTLGEANLERVIDALHEFSALPVDARDRRPLAARALLGELWNAIRAHSARTRDDAPARLERLPLRPVLLLRGGSMIAVDLRTVDVVFINDDPTRAVFVGDLNSATQLPAMRDVQALIIGLRALLGVHRVVTTSEAPIDTGFVAAPSVEPRPLFEVLDEAFRDRDVPTDLGMLLVFAPGRRDVDPRKRDFTDFWAALERTRVQRGSFAPGDGKPPTVRAYCDKKAGTLHVVSDARPADIAEATWPLAGVAYRELWSSYARALGEGDVEVFFAERQIGHADRETIQAFTRRGQAAKLKPLRSAAFAVRTARGQDDLAEFHAGWEEHVGSVDDLDAWLGGGLRTALLRAVEANGEEEASLVVLDAAAVPVDAWQRARAVLTLPPWSFASTRASWNEAADALVQGLKSEAAHRAGVDLVAAQCALEEIAGTAPGDEVCGLRLAADEVLARLLAVADSAFRRAGGPDALGALHHRTMDLLAASPGSRCALLNGLGTAREKEIYRRDPEARRTHEASTTRDELLTVAVPLAPHHGEAIDRSSITADARVAAFSAGFWANRFGVLATLQRTLHAAAPKTAKTLSDKRAFHEHINWRQLWVLLPELGPLPGSGAPPKPPPRFVEIFGAKEQEDAIGKCLALGTAGALGTRIRSFVDGGLDLLSLGRGPRAPISAIPPGKGSRSHWASSGSSSGEPKAERDLNGALGEIFVYEQFRAKLADFDELAWVSNNRTVYGFSAGDDEAGYDFRYIDVAGMLSGCATPVECQIEVKATSGDGAAPFPLTMNEWLRAQACHESRSTHCYLIVRVAFVRSSPIIFDIIRDPVGLASQGQLSMVSKDLWVRTARPGAAGAT
ncbi:protein NO VEIN domain-containing protein [Sorangium sp. So ce1335]|uniref:protein NO VEIN domain-containing protein n=1 Tax=Sorangium sp. So ce1335 TaxID=3133335 RepID=UPI003F5DA68C